MAKRQLSHAGKLRRPSHLASKRRPRHDNARHGVRPRAGSIRIAWTRVLNPADGPHVDAPPNALRRILQTATSPAKSSPPHSDLSVYGLRPTAFSSPPVN